MLIFSGKIPVRVNPLFLLLIGIIGWINSFSIPQTVVWMGVIFISVLVHELGHALTALAFGQRSEIELHGLGGVTRREGPTLKLWQEFIIVLNGPLAGLTLFFASYSLSQMIGGDMNNLFVYALMVSIYVNLFWTFVNLLPVHPLDGGQLLRIFLEGIFGFRGVKIALFLSMVIAALIGVFFIKIGAILIAVLFFFLAFESYRNWEGAMALTAKDQRVDLQMRIKEAEENMNAGRRHEALEQFLEIREEARSGVIFMAATEYASEILIEEGHFNEAYAILYPLRKKVSDEALRRLHFLAYQIGNLKEAIALGNRAYQNFPNYETALLNSLCHAVKGEVQPAVGWLQTAINQGLPNLGEVLKKREFDSIRQDETFQNIITQVRE